jgi:hypothetical protein
VVAESATRNTYFSQIERRTSVLSSAVTPDRSSASCSDARARSAAVVFAHDDALHGAGLVDHAGREMCVAT